MPTHFDLTHIINYVVVLHPSDPGQVNDYHTYKKKLTI